MFAKTRKLEIFWSGNNYNCFYKNILNSIYVKKKQDSSKSAMRNQVENFYLEIYKDIPKKN